MSIALRREDAADRRAKESGVAIEAQTGDGVFDEEVFIDTPSKEDVVGRVLASPALRRAVRELLDRGVGPITLDEAGRIEVRIDSFGGLRDDPGWVLERLAQIATDVSEVTASGGAHPPDRARGLTAFLGILALTGSIVTPIVVFSVLPDRCYDSDGEAAWLSCASPGCCQPSLGGALAGVLVGLSLAFAVFVRIRGTSSAHRLRRWAALFAFLVAVEGAQVLAHAFGAVLLR
jgi:hypothetical protein